MRGMLKLTLCVIALLPGARVLAADQPKPDEKGCICMDLYLPVCAALPDGKSQTFSNACFAKCASATIIHQGAC
jgi:hypothetical protein